MEGAPVVIVLEVSSVDWANLIVGAVGAAGTIAALVVAILLGLHEARRFRREAADRDRDRRAQEEAQERSQAERVSAIASVDREPKQRYSLGRTDGRADFRDEQVHYAYADVLNSSALPIYDVKVLYPEGDRLAAIRVGFVPGGEKGHVHLPPQPDAVLDGFPLEVAFRDAGERWWSRCPEGHLHRHEDDPYPRPESRSSYS
jgi:hypothetical protein